MTALEAVATYLPQRRVPLEELAGELDLTPMQVRLFRRFHKLSDVCRAPGAAPLDLLLAAVSKLDDLPAVRHRVRYVLWARTFPVVVPYPLNPLDTMCRLLGLDQAVAFTVTHHACATGLLAIDVAGRLLAGSPPDALALVVAGEKAFTHDARVVPETSVFGEGASACLVRHDGPRDRLLAYAVNQRGDFDDEVTTDTGRFQEEYQASLMAAIRAAVDRAGVAIDDIALVLPHNVNVVAWQRLCRRIGYPVDRVLLDNVPLTAHVFCADAFVNYQTARARGLLRPGDRYLVAAAGAGRGATFSAMVFAH
ncbi:3-oxoacyl-[acyl-carrier-protein] synthase III C-terminal domain-containing protein [Phytohabitans sp. ZYX-F-186]|uniref:3-oxoacyl-[acyl-carrier-protein] synthase III C-terminal domain-containing protein n=1 Tax=Phytohabitans maris TaxID=3071409 RepID=A0ABU0ZX28_9ACTN|nr:3-oxoacyl-[acyl-carrier-protein] synthase III C-terminal domain-containing protein [Phytohabitans sp. ZYX-F-186]MDQ7910869.1 3-oxoacyl-[acyl-carrier-protein] synthase III C-terminal domain-containing protein [Phytohabitans sp. ZYX-F-186]